MQPLRAMEQRQRGQSMAEYTVVVVALVTALLVTPNSVCGPNDNESCVSYLLSVMQDNYQGYSSSISDVQTYYIEVDGTIDDDGDDDGGGSNTGGTGSEPGICGINPCDGTGLTVTNELEPSLGCAATAGIIQEDNTVVDLEGDQIGTYDPDTNTVTYDNGCEDDNPQINEVVQDCEGSVLDKQAIIDRSSGEVVGFGYFTDADGCEGLFLTGNINQAIEFDTTQYRLERVQSVVDDDGNTIGGGIVGSLYYINTVTVVLAEQDATGEVVEFNFNDASKDACAVMVDGWDDDASDDDERGDLLFDPDGGKIGFKDPVDTASFGCDPNQTVTES